MRVATILSPPFTISYENVSSIGGLAGGVEVEIIKVLAKTFNFTPIFMYEIFVFHIFC